MTCLHEMFEAQAARNPDATALVFETQHLTYGCLNQRANELAHRLRACGVGPETVVGLHVRRSLDLAIGMLGILKAGAAYLPVDPTLPPDRVDFMLADAGAAWVVSTRAHALVNSARPVLWLDDVVARARRDNPAPRALPQNLAYVMYTSGTSGRPKGVMISHANVTRLFAETAQQFAFQSDDIWTLFHSYAFDFSVWELFGALLHGAKLVIVPAHVVGTPDAFLALLSREGVTFLNQTPSAFFQLLAVLEWSPRCSLALRAVVFGGEALPVKRLEPWFAHAASRRVRLVNMYGITETTVHVTSREIGRIQLQASSASPIGEALPDLAVHVLDASGDPLPDGMAGEIYVGGAGLARGYCGQAALTAQRFVPHPAPEQPGARLYRSGDLALRRADGELDYRGRIDTQVQLRGFRIELGEIESVLCRTPFVSDAAVVLRELAGQPGLVAYVVLREQHAHPTRALREVLRAQLPAYMVPESWVVLDQLPLTPHGKLDRTALATPSERAREPGQSAFEAPRTPAEVAMAQVWSAVLGVAFIGIDDNYFDLGGDSIRSIALIAGAREQGMSLSIAELYREPTVRRLVAHCLAQPTPPLARESERFAFVRAQDRVSMDASVEDAYPLTQLQRGLVFHSDSPGYEVYVASYHLRIPFDASKLRHALERLVQRHPYLRTSFELGCFSEPLQLVARTCELPLEFEDLRQLTEEARESAIALRIEREKRRRIDWARPPLFHCVVQRRTDASFQFTLVEPYLDGWSVALFMTELFAIYGEQLAQRSADDMRTHLPSFGDYVAAERAALDTAASRTFWQQELGRVGAGLIGYAPVHAAGDARGIQRAPVEISASVSARLRALAKRSAVPLKSVLLAAHMRVVSMLTGHARVTTGLTTNGRLEAAGADRVIGLFLNLVPFSVDCRLDVTELIQSVFELEQRILPHRRYPLAQLRKDHGSALFESVFNFTDFHPYRALDAAGSLEIVSASASDQTFFPLTAQFHLRHEDSALVLLLDYQPERFTSAQVSAIAGYYQRALACMLDEPRTPLSSEQLLSESERRLLCEHSSVGPIEGGRDDRCIHELFDEQAARTPDAIALVVPERQARFTYAAIARQADRLARCLRDAGVEPESVVGVCLPRDAQLLISVLAVLKAGAAYLPLDPGYPPERLRFMLEDTRARWVLCDATTGALFSDADGGGSRLQTLDVERVLAQAPHGGTDSARRVRPENLAYIIFTSGSTGVPNGVAIEHRNLVNLLGWCARAFETAELEGVLAGTSLCFDLSLFELFAPLSTGGTVYLVESALSLSTAGRWRGVTLINTVPSAMRALLKAGAVPDTVRTVNLAGEALDQSLVDEIYRVTRARRVVDLYGPSETTTYSTACERERGGEQSIGRPVAHTDVQILDADLQRLAPGIAGELCIGGRGLARGYFGRAALTARKYLPHPSSTEPGARLYASGDLARHLSDGRLAYLGRRDTQVKLRGFRIDLCEIEALLATHPAVAEAAVAIQIESDGRAQLVAHVVGQPGLHAEPDALRAYLKSRLPPHMVPSAFSLLGTLPRLPNGKLARAALPRHIVTRQDGAAAISGEVPALLARLWADTLGVAAVGPNDDYYALGGDSITSIQIVARARQHGLRISSRQILDHPTITALARVAQRAASASVTDAVGGAVPMTPIMHWWLEQGSPDLDHWNQAVVLQPVTALEPVPLRAAVRALLIHHDALRLRIDRSAAADRMYIAEPDERVPLRVIRLADTEAADAAGAIERIASEIQRSLSLTDGPLLRVCSIAWDEGRAQRLLIVAHHLVVDGVSWRILVADLERAYQQAGRAEPIRLPDKTGSFQAWAQRLVRYAVEEDLSRAQHYWCAPRFAAPAALPRDRAQPGRHNVESSAATFVQALEAEETAALLRDLPRAYGTQINDALLTALARALAHWQGADEVAIAVEGHGREESLLELDVSRTVGWFTTIYPVQLKLDRTAEVQATLQMIRDQLREVPDRGFGYGVLRYLRADHEGGRGPALPPEPEVCFNYLGQFDRDLSGDALFRLARESFGDVRSPRARRAYLLNVIGRVVEGRLEISWTYSRHVHEPATIERLARAFMSDLRRLIRLGAQTAVALNASASVALDSYPLSPFQEGILAQCLDARGSNAYVIQIDAVLAGALDVAAFSQAWKLVIARHDALRTSFHWQRLAHPVQIVHSDVELTLEYADLCDLDAREQSRYLSARSAEASGRGFALEQAPLLHILLARTSEREHRFLWTHHHLILDGWSQQIVLREVITAYAALQRGQPTASPVAPSYRSYIEWVLAGELSSARQYWQALLADFQPTLARHTEVGAATAHSYGGLLERLSSELSERLLAFTRVHQLTLNTLVRGAWALTLAALYDLNDITFGAVVSGRTAPIPGVEAMVGTLINSLPVRAQITPGVSVLRWLRDLQAQQQHSQQYEYTSLAELRRWLGIRSADALFDSVLVFENFPSLAWNGEQPFEVRDIQTDVQEQVALVLVVVPAAELAMRLKYDRRSFSDMQAEWLSTTLRQLLIGLSERPDQPVAALLAACGRKTRDEQQTLQRERNRARVDALRVRPIRPR